jgi:hypothetical protein
MSWLFQGLDRISVESIYRQKLLLMPLKRIFVFSILLIHLSKGDGQVNLQTGSANFSLPVFNWQDNKSRLATSISFAYNSGNGLKVNDVASNIGQGWSLAAGGVITRLQVGEPDDQNKYDGNQRDQSGSTG